MGDKTRNKGEVRNHPTAFGIKKKPKRLRRRLPLVVGK